MVVELVNTSATHSFVSKRTTTSLHNKLERNKSAFKVVKSIMKSVVGVVHATPLKVGDWYDILDLVVAPLDDHVVVLGK